MKTGKLYKLEEKEITAVVVGRGITEIGLLMDIVDDEEIITMINTSENLGQMVKKRHQKYKYQLKTVHKQKMTARVRYTNAPNNPDAKVITGIEWVN